MIDPKDNYADDPNDALRREDDVDHINEIAVMTSVLSTIKINLNKQMRHQDHLSN